jgi:ISXO2-like transposase domain/Transposase zinc-ribbon domain
MSKPMTLKQFLAKFPNDDVCLQHLFDTRFGSDIHCPKCKQVGTFHRLRKLPAFTCNCGHHIHPMAGTPFERSRTPLTTWFHVMFLFCASRNGVAAKEVQRQTGVTYKTAWRLCNEIRKYMGWVDGDGQLGGPGKPRVEVDKMFIGGYDKKGKDDKSVVLGMMERDGEVVTRVVPSRRASSVIPEIRKTVVEGARGVTDDAYVFQLLPEWGYEHGSVNHSQKEYVRGDVHTNSIEAFWLNVKRAISGTYVWVSKKHLQTYLREFEYRHNLRRSPHVTFDLLLFAFPKASQ